MRARVLIASVALAVDVAVAIVAVATHNPLALVVSSVALVIGYNYLAQQRRVRK